LRLLRKYRTGCVALLQHAYKGLGPNVRARLEYNFQKERHINQWGGPFNNQAIRREIVLLILKRFDPDVIVETGTYRGDTTEFLAERFRRPITTIEVDDYSFHFSRIRLSANPHVKVEHRDSVLFLRQQALNSDVVQKKTFFYLDAHWRERLPLPEELALIAESWSSAVCLIDDFQIPDQPGYGYDDYGPDKVLSIALLAKLPRRGHLYFPAALESGYKRGCAVVTFSPRNAAILDEIGELRPYPWPMSPVRDQPNVGGV
jgi:hypothetical protein